MKHEEIEQYKLELKELSKETDGAYKKINCPSCQQAVSADNMNINDKIAKCSTCDVIFSFNQEAARLLSKEQTKQEVLRPEGIDLFYFKNDLDISLEQPITALEGIFTFFSSLLAMIFTAGLINGKVPIWLVATTWSMSMLSIFNLIRRNKHKVYINISAKQLNIQWRPSKFIKDRSYATQDINQLYLTALNGQYALNMIVDAANGQKHVKIVSGISSLSKAQYLEQEIVRYLDIKDRPVPEEIKP